MYEMFDKATGFVLDYYSKNEKSSSCLCTYRKYLIKLRAYLQASSFQMHLLRLVSVLKIKG